MKRVEVNEGEAVTVDFLLEPSASVLDEVVVTGTVIATERKALTTPITVITGEEIEERGITRIEQFLRGEVPGVFVQDMGSENYSAGDIDDPQLGAMVTSRVFSRGQSRFGPE